MFGQALKIDPNSPGAQAGLARVLADTGQDLDYVFTLAQSAAGRVPEDPASRTRLPGFTTRREWMAWLFHSAELHSQVS